MANSDILQGDQLFRQRARKALPYLVRQAKAGQPIFYSDLAQEIGISNPRNLNHILGAIGDGLIELGERTDTEIPPIQCLVLNKQTGFPSEGIDYVIDIKKFKTLTKSQQKRIVERTLINIFAFDYWDWVLEELELKPVKMNLKSEIEKAKRMGGIGESSYHKAFKKFISENPAIIGLPEYLSKGQMEYCLPSSDSIDVLFKDKATMIGVEVKSKISDKADILRGLFQCVKYKFLLEAEQIVKDQIPDTKTILVLEEKFPSDLVIVKNLLGIHVVDNIKNRS